MRLPPLHPADGTWPYQQIAGALRRAIRDGGLTHGDRLVGVLLADHYNVRHPTAMKALKELQLAGVVAPRPGRRGLFVTAPPAGAGQSPAGEALTLRAVATLLGVTPPVVVKLVKDGRLTYADPGAPRGDRTVTVDSLAAYLAAPNRYGPDILPSEAAAALLNLSLPRTRQLVDEGRLVAPPSTRGVTVASVAALLAGQREEVVATLKALGFYVGPVSNANGPTYGLLAKLLREVRSQADGRDVRST